MLKLLLFFIFIFNSTVSISESEDDLIDTNTDDMSLVQDDDIDETSESLKEIDDEIEYAQHKEKESNDKVEILSTLDEVLIEENAGATEREILDELSELRKRNINEIIQVKKRDIKNKYTSSEMQALRIQLEDIARSPLYVARLNRGTFILDIKTHKKLYLTKDINVKIHKLADYDKYLYIINKKGELRYRVYNSSAQNISDITNLYHKPRFFKPVVSVQKVETFDKNFKYTMNINLHGGFHFPRYTKELLTDTTGISTQTRVELGFLTNHDFIFNYGFTGMYEATAGSLSTANGLYTIKTFSMGPIIKTKPLIGGFQFSLASRMSIISDVLETRSTVSRVHKLSEISLSLGVEKETKSSEYGSFIWGVNFQRKWLRAKAQNVAFDLSSTDNYDESLTLYVGHQSDWVW
jgi:hypothetical protein